MNLWTRLSSLLMTGLHRQKPERFRWQTREELELRVRQIVAEERNLPLEEVTLDTELSCC